MSEIPGKKTDERDGRSKHSLPVRIFMGVCIAIWGSYTFIYAPLKNRNREENEARAAMAMSEQFQREKKAREDAAFGTLGPVFRDAFADLQATIDALSGATIVGPDEVKALIEEESEILVLDVRTAGEFSKGHLPGAIHLDFHAANFKQSLKELDATRPWLIHCASGERSRPVLKAAAEAGALELFYFEGGLDAWKDAGLPVE